MENDDLPRWTKNVGLKRNCFTLELQGEKCLFLLVQVHREPELVRGCASNVIISTETALEAQLIDVLAAAYSFPLTLTINIWHGEPDFLAVVSLLGWPS